MRHHSVLVIGGSGFIGSHIVARLAAEGRRVIVPTRRLSHARHLQVLPTVQIVQADVFNEATLAQWVARADAVINLVGVLHARPAHPWGAAFERAHVELPRRIARACLAQGVQRVLHMSALGASAEGPSMYLRSKAAGERVLRETAGLSLTCFRPSVVFGPEDKFLNVFAQLQAMLPVLVLGSTSAKFQPVYVGDVAQAFVHALDDPRSIGQVYELVGPHRYTLAELVRLAGVYSGHPRPLITLPTALSRLQAFMLEYLPGGPLMSRDNLDSMKADNVASGQNPLPPDWRPTPLEAVAPDYLAPQ